MHLSNGDHHPESPTGLPPSAPIWRQPGFAAAYAREHAWLSTATRLAPPASRLLAARIAGGVVECGAVVTEASRTCLGQLRGAEPPALGKLAHALGLAASDDELGAADAVQLRHAWPISLPIDALLASGGDDRLALDARTGLNRYGCAPHPRTDVISFGSCTASSLSPGAYDAAERGRRRLIAASLTHGCEAALRSACAELEGAILKAFHCADLADAILTASGTDAALTVTALLSAERASVPITSIVVSPAETGSGVPLAVQGCHFAELAPSGQTVIKGECLSGLITPPRLVTIDVRDTAGQPLAPDAIVRACDSAIRAALPRGRVVLHAIDGSKTGLTAPDRTALLRLSRDHGGNVDIVVDACQARVEPALIRGYLEAGFPVLVTGSKFFGAPGFCGAILFPRDRLTRLIARAESPAGLAAYVGSAGSFGSRCCPGLLLRWTAALHEMARFGALPNEEVSRRLDVFGAGVQTALQCDGRLHLVTAPRPKGSGWSSRRSVFTFTVSDKRGPLDPHALRRLYLAMQDDVSGTAIGQRDAALAAIRCQLGQPVQLGNPSIGGLRIAASAADLVANLDQSGALGGVIGKLRLLLQCSESRVGALSEAAA